MRNVYVTRLSSGPPAISRAVGSDPKKPGVMCSNRGTDALLLLPRRTDMTRSCLQQLPYVIAIHRKTKQNQVHQSLRQSAPPRGDIDPDSSVPGDMNQTLVCAQHRSRGACSSQLNIGRARNFLPVDMRLRMSTNTVA